MNGNKGTTASTEAFGNPIHPCPLLFTLRATHRIRCIRIRVGTSSESIEMKVTPESSMHWHHDRQRFSLLARGRGGLNGEFGRISVSLLGFTPDLP